jgi:hypothetical protein
MTSKRIGSILALLCFPFFVGCYVSNYGYNRNNYTTTFPQAQQLGANTSNLDSDEISLYNSSLQATAYIAEDLTLYLWSGKPVAYLDNDSVGGFHVYGFNGKHLGWFVGGIIRDHQGNVVGAVAEAFSVPPVFAPFKSFKEFKPFKSFKEFAPFRPFFMNNWSDTDLKLFLLQGAAN